MRSGFDVKLEHLNNDLIRMGGLIEEAIANSIKALHDCNKPLAESIIKNDRVIDDIEKSIESQSLAIILREQPVAKDLRKVSAALKMVTDMERIADNAADIAEIFLTSGTVFSLQPKSEIREMAEKVIIMVSDAVTAFVKTDLTLATIVMDRDDEIDALFNLVKNNLISELKFEKGNYDVAIDTLMIAKYLERIADHAVNICEWVEFFETGEYKKTQII